MKISEEAGQSNDFIDTHPKFSTSPFAPPDLHLPEPT